MNSDQLNALWHSPDNRPDADSGRRLAEHFVATVRRRRRFQAMWLGWTFFALTAASVLALVQSGRAANGFAGQWALLPLLAAPWLTALYFLRAFFTETAASSRPVLPLRAALIAARDSNHAMGQRLVAVTALLITMFPVSVLAVWQLHATGKAPGHQAWSMAAVFTVALAGGLTGVAFRYFRCIAPERRVIEEWLRELDTPAAS